ncbi:GIDE domain-containing protein [Dactylococcopsis salina]|uniref:GIDE domain-containing protein n=1 Tax=Dactylococcopsis salina TaxID=292566 RepID=UPI00059D1089|nr:GIDE domain-containing protein [Dactylococcopsis salina]
MIFSRDIFSQGIKHFQYNLIAKVKIEFSPRNDAEYQTLGYEFQEVILPVNIQVYIIGEASDRAGDLELDQPSEENQLFLISYKSEEELSEEKRGDIKKNKKIAQICFFSVIAFIVFALINLLN